MKNPFISILLLLLASVHCAYGAFPTTGTSQDAYCHVPPYVTQNVKPNINLILDFSGSMQFPAYLHCSPYDIPGDHSHMENCEEKSYNANSDFSYKPGRNYYGNFKNDIYYRYNSTAGHFEENPFCSDIDRVGGISGGCFSGNLLNWITTTRTDVLRKILTGGRVKASTTDVLESEGSRYVVTDETLNCTFTVTGSSTTGRKLKVENESRRQLCALGTFSDYNIDVKTTTPNDDITGIVQSMYPGLADLELSVYNSSVDPSYRVGKNKDTIDYLNAINTEFPYTATPTGEALQEAQYYFQQSEALLSDNKKVVLGKENYTHDPYYESGKIPAPCRKSFTLLISDGQWNGKIDPVKPAHKMRKNDQRTESALAGKQNVTTYAIYAFGDGNSGRQAMITTALFGGYDDKDGNGWPYPFTSLPYNSKTVTYPRSDCDPDDIWNTECSEWDRDRTGLPYNFFEADDGAALQTAITKAVNYILGSVTSGTAASVLGNNDYDGATLLQALYFPEKQFNGGTKASWLGETQALWYYIDPRLNNSAMNIREDSTQDKRLVLSQDKIASFDFNGTQVEVNLYHDGNSDGEKDDKTPDKTVSVDTVKALWRAGLSLWARPPSGADGRTIYTKNPVKNSLMNFSTANSNTLKTYLDVEDNDTDAKNVIRYTRGVDLPDSGYRNRTVSIDGKSGVWKLGDIINSTPQLISGSPLNTYGNVSPGGYSDTSYTLFSTAKNYKNRETAFIGANDGMLHAFKMGTTSAGSGSTLLRINKTKEKDYDDLGKEQWAYVPHNALPYLKHLGNPSYKHLFYVDSTPLIVDASVGVTKLLSESDILTCDEGLSGETPYYTCPKLTTLDAEGNFVLATDDDPTDEQPTVGTSWRTILIGSMGMGGATRDHGVSCTDCVAAPMPGTGCSSYFALDVTEPEAPKLLWEFSHPRLGFSTVRPAVVRIQDPKDNSTDGISNLNGRWFVVLANGPTGPIDAGSNQMKGYSDQSLTIFVLDLKTGSPLRTFSADPSAIITDVDHTTYEDMPPYAFGGRFSDPTIDTDRWKLGKQGNYSDDALYLGYVRKDTDTDSPSAGKFTKGGVIRILTGDSEDPADWKLSKVIDNIGPVSSGVKKLQDKKNRLLWLLFGTGRYYFKIGTDIDEDYAEQREALYGIKEPCYIAAENDLSGPDCEASVEPSELENQTTSVSPVAKQPGWKILLAEAKDGFNAQRIITTPVTTSTGVVFFTAFKPSTDICGYGGTTSLWAVTYNNGGEASSLLRGQALLQLSTGAFEQIDLSDSFTQSGRRETSGRQGVPPVDEPPVLSNANHFPSKKILHILER